MMSGHLAETQIKFYVFQPACSFLYSAWLSTSAHEIPDLPLA